MVILRSESRPCCADGDSPHARNAADDLGARISGRPDALEIGADQRFVRPSRLRTLGGGATPRNRAIFLSSIR